MSSEIRESQMIASDSVLFEKLESDLTEVISVFKRFHHAVYPRVRVDLYLAFYDEEDLNGLPYNEAIAHMRTRKLLKISASTFKGKIENLQDTIQLFLEVGTRLKKSGILGAVQ